MNKIFNIFTYYILLLIGLIATSWIIWSRFIRERVIRDIPDGLLTEYRFWILLYICCIYFYVVKNLIKESEPYTIFIEINKVIRKYFWKPLITLDHFIKYNKHCEEFYYIFMSNMSIHWLDLSIMWRRCIILSFQIIPRIILVSFLLLDTFYFQKLELFYKVVLIGLLPFTFRYLRYCFNDFYDNLIKRLTDKYDKVHIFEKGYSYDISRKDNTEAVWHYDYVSVEEYIEIMYETPFDCIRENTSYEYVGAAYCKKEIYKQYEKQFNKPIANWTREERQEVTKLFEELILQILVLKHVLNNVQSLKKEKIIIWPQIGIFSLYLICWGYILVISYYNYPIELPMFKYFIANFLKYLINGDLFIYHLYSVNENLITIQNVKCLIVSIINIIITTIKNSIIK